MATLSFMDYYDKALTKSPSPVMVPTTTGQPYVPNYNAPKSSSTSSTKTSTGTTSSKSAAPSEADINKQLMEDAIRAYQERVAAGMYDTPSTGGTSSTPTQPQIIIQQPQYDPMELINEMKRAQRQARIAQLDKAKSAALGALDTEKANVAPIYYDKRNQAAAQADIGAMNFAQYMAARGIKGAAGAMPEIYRQAGLQGQIGALDRQEAANLAAIERQRSLIEQGYASDVAAAQADIESQAMQAAIDQWNRDRAYALQQAAQDLEQAKFDWSKSPSNPEYQAIILANKMRELEIAAQEIQNSYLPETEKLRAERLRQQVVAGKYDADMALAQLNQIRAQINATNALANQRQNQTDENMSAYRSHARTLYNNADTPEEAKATVIDYAESLQKAGVPESTIRQLLIEFGIAL